MQPQLGIDLLGLRWVELNQRGSGISSVVAGNVRVPGRRAAPIPAPSVSALDAAGTPGSGRHSDRACLPAAHGRRRAAAHASRPAPAAHRASAESDVDVDRPRRESRGCDARRRRDHCHRGGSAGWLGIRAVNPSSAGDDQMRWASLARLFRPGGRQPRFGAETRAEFTPKKRESSTSELRWT